MTLKQKREIVVAFMGGESTGILWVRYNNGMPPEIRIEQVLRDYINGKFTLEPKRGKRK